MSHFLQFSSQLRLVNMFHDKYKKNEYDEAMKLLRQVRLQTRVCLLCIIIIPIITIGEQLVSFMQINVPINVQYLTFLS